MMHNSTALGIIVSVSSTSVVAKLLKEVDSGLLVIQGRTHKVGQVGSFIRIPQGYNDLYGIVSSSSESNSSIKKDDTIDSSQRFITIELVGESSGNHFDRGISQYPSVNDEIHLVLEENLKVVYGNEGDNLITVGHLASSESINVNIDIDKLVTRHSAIVGSTGSGKSTSVTSILRSLCCPDNTENVKSSARIILVDIHGEYSNALRDIAHVFSISPSAKQKQLHIPFWALPTDKLIDFLCGSMSESYKNNMIEMIVEEKKKSIPANNYDYIDDNKVTPYTPLPFSIKKIWYDSLVNDTSTYQEDTFQTLSYLDGQIGNAEELIPPKFTPPEPGKKAPYKKGPHALTKQLNLMKARLLDSQYGFFLSPDNYTPDENGKVEKDLYDLLSEWLDHEKPISILDLSGMPSTQFDTLLGSILNMLFEASIWGRNLPNGFKNHPVLFVLEEAHRYLSGEFDGLTKSLVQRIAKEGRKFGVGLMIISQRPSEIDDTILSQCGTLFSLRLSNSTDRSKVKAAMSDGLSSLIDTLPVLRTGEAIIIGEAAKLPARCKFKLPPDGFYPDSVDPKVSEAWGKERKNRSFEKLVMAWRLNKPLNEDGEKND
ncbi:ATP-binding protein [Pantoea agglomerans]|uniref:ATP-binding protein n=1 Tax=Enterobacter agglomerans TaxID=549 RepID=UPI000DAD88FF|nr:ATP-binding protein [Pantoea agglomerans]RAH30328.1 ATPase [Pantoea agglomerans]TGX91422.1 ATP-binding protein [Pantoea agglomerans]